MGVSFNNTMPVKQWLFCCISISKLNQSSQHSMNTAILCTNQGLYTKDCFNSEQVIWKKTVKFKTDKNQYLHKHVEYSLSRVTQWLHGSIHILKKKKKA